MCVHLFAENAGQVEAALEALSIAGRIFSAANSR
jgi:hypothetical protein